MAWATCANNHQLSIVFWLFRCEEKNFFRVDYCTNVGTQKKTKNMYNEVRVHTCVFLRNCSLKIWSLFWGSLRRQWPPPRLLFFVFVQVVPKFCCGLRISTLYENTRIRSRWLPAYVRGDCPPVSIMHYCSSCDLYLESSVTVVISENVSAEYPFAHET